MNVFYTVMEAYGKDQNPLGKELYETQIDYISKVTSGHDFILDKKKKK